jgi:hypothetical protein
MGYLGSLPEDCDIEKVSANGCSLMSLKPDALCLTALRQMGDKIWQ